MSNKVQKSGVLGKAFKNANGYWSINVDEVWYSTYKDDHSALEGQNITFEAESVTKNGKTYWNGSKIKADTSAAPAPAARGGGGGGDARQISIVRQSSYKLAVDVVLGLKDELLPAKTTKAKALDLTLSLIDEVAATFYTSVIEGGPFVESEEEDDDPSAPPSSDFDPANA